MNSVYTITQVSFSLLCVFFVDNIMTLMNCKIKLIIILDRIKSQK